MPEPAFHFKRFSLRHDRCAVKVGTDALLLGGWTDFSHAEHILDIGTGCGVLALIAAQLNPTARIDAVEIDDAAYSQAAENFAASPWPDRLRAHHMDARRLNSARLFDLIICNPPFYAGEMGSPDPRKGLAKHSGALVFPELIEQADRLLSDRGRLSVIIPVNREYDLVEDADRVGLNPSRRCEVSYLAGKPPKRLLLEFRRGEQATTNEHITVAGANAHDFTSAYRALLADLKEF